jgi:hypothetical protein
VRVGWDPQRSGTYYDGATRVPCGVLLHELEHAARYFRGQECTGALSTENAAAYRYDESLGVRAENWWIWNLERHGRRGLRQRTGYGPGQQLGKWTRWPRGGPVPPRPPCVLYSVLLQVDQGDGGTVSVSPQGRPGNPPRIGNAPYFVYPPGTTVTLTATPNADYVFARWSSGTTCGNDPATATSSTCSFTLPDVEPDGRLLDRFDQEVANFTCVRRGGCVRPTN